MENDTTYLFFRGFFSFLDIFAKIVVDSICLFKDYQFIFVTNIYMFFHTVVEDMKSAMKAKDTEKLKAVRSLFAAIKKDAIDAGIRDNDIPDDISMKVVKKLVKQRKEAIKQYIKGGRPELAAGEKSELVILEAYLPEMLSEEEVEKVALTVKNELGISDPSKFGQLMGAVMKALAGKEVDAVMVKTVIQKLLS